MNKFKPNLLLSYLQRQHLYAFSSKITFIFVTSSRSLHHWHLLVHPTTTFHTGDTGTVPETPLTNVLKCPCVSTLQSRSLSRSGGSVMLHGTDVCLEKYVLSSVEVTRSVSCENKLKTTLCRTSGRKVTPLQALGNKNKHGEIDYTSVSQPLSLGTPPNQNPKSDKKSL